MAAFADKPLSFPLDVERVVDDIVLFCMLVGNDFLPGEGGQGGGRWPGSQMALLGELLPASVFYALLPQLCDKV